MENEKSKVKEMPAPPIAQQMNVPPELLMFAAILDEKTPGHVNFLIGDSMVAAAISPAAVYNLLGALRTSIRQWAAQKGNKALADGL